MSLFQFFKKNRIAISSVDDIKSPTPKNETGQDIDQELFVCIEKPGKQPECDRQDSAIDEFFDQDFENQGFHDGYYFKNNSLMENKLRYIGANFRLVVDKMLDMKRKEINEIKLELVRIAGISPSLELLLSDKQKQIEACIHDLDVQKILSTENEGIVASVIQCYRIGFMKGVEQYLQEKLLAGSTGLFN